MRFLHYKSFLILCRLSLEEKLYQRELEAAIEASIKDSQSSDDNGVDNDSPLKNLKKEKKGSTDKENKPKTKDEKEAIDSNDEKQPNELDNKQDTSPESLADDDSKSGKYLLNF